MANLTALPLVHNIAKLYNTLKRVIDSKKEHSIEKTQNILRLVDPCCQFHCSIYLLWRRLLFFPINMGSN